MGWIERAYEEIESEFEEGLIDAKEYRQQISDLRREIEQEERENCRDDEYD